MRSRHARGYPRHSRYSAARPWRSLAGLLMSTIRAASGHTVHEVHHGGLVEAGSSGHEADMMDSITAVAIWLVTSAAVSTLVSTTMACEDGSSCCLMGLVRDSRPPPSLLPWPAGCSLRPLTGA